MKLFNRSSTSFSERIRGEGLDSLGARFALALKLSVPSILAQLSAIVMQLIDASMVGSLGAEASASIGLVSTTTWLFMGVCSASAVGFSVQVAHLLGAGKRAQACSVVRQALTATMIVALAMAVIGVAVSGALPGWLGGSEDIRGGASAYFMIFSLAMPVLQLSFLSGSMLRCSGNTFVPGILSVAMCVLDVVFNYFLIYPAQDVSLFGMTLPMPGAGLGVEGAALGTMSAEAVTAALMTFYLWRRSPELSMRDHKSGFRPLPATIRRALKIGMPMGVERLINSAAQITLTVIVAPLGSMAIAANAFGITAESLCYMPGYGIADAATTLVGQSLGAHRRELAVKFARLTIAMGMAIMTVMGIVMYIAAPALMGMMSPVPEIVDLGAEALRIEAWAEPMFAASIVAYGAFVGAGDTVVPCVINLGSMWIIRISLAALLAPVMGLKGVWLAMCVELCCRGLFFLIRLKSGRWLNRINRL